MRADLPCSVHVHTAVTTDKYIRREKTYRQNLHFSRARICSLTYLLILFLVLKLPKATVSGTRRL